MVNHGKEAEVLLVKELGALQDDCGCKPLCSLCLTIGGVERKMATLLTENLGLQELVDRVDRRKRRGELRDLQKARKDAKEANKEAKGEYQRYLAVKGELDALKARGIEQIILDYLKGTTLQVEQFAEIMVASLLEADCPWADLHQLIWDARPKNGRTEATAPLLEL